MKKYYFAYGSNMNTMRMDYRMNNTESKLSKFSKGKYSVVGKGVLHNWTLKFNSYWEGSVYANIDKKIGSIVEGVIYEIDLKGLERLDYFEDCPNNYLKKSLKVEYTNKNGESSLLSCVVYIANPKTIKNGFKTTKKYLSQLLKGKVFLSKKYFEKLSKTKTI